MNARDPIRKVLAFHAGRPLPRGSMLRMPKREPTETLVLAFVRMGGESRPWGVAIGRPDKTPSIFTVPEARDRELVGGMLEQVAPVLLSHMSHPSYGRRSYPSPLPHVWLPNASHLEMLHFLAFTYTYARRGEPARMKVLNTLGRAANWLFQESTRPGQTSCIDASRALGDAFTFPADDLRQAHTGYLLAWLETNGGFDKRWRAATNAEQHAVATSLDPQIEKDGLADAVESFNEAKRAGNTSRARNVAEQIRRALEPELRHRFDVAVRAYNLLQGDGRQVNPGVQQLQAAASERHEEWLQQEARLADGEKVWITSPETDSHSLVAASAFITFEAEDARYVNALVHHDEELQDELLLVGDGFRGNIVDIETRSLGRTTRAVWIVDEDAERPLRVRPGDTVVQAGYEKRKAALREIRQQAGKPRTVALEITAGIRKEETQLGRPPLDRWWIGRKVTFLRLDDPGFAFRRRKMIWERGGPGSWLTHRQPWQDWASTGGEDDHDADAGAA